MIQNPEKKSKTEKAKDAYTFAEEKLANKFTVASILFAVIGPLLLKILEAIGMIIFVVPFNEQFTVYINMTILLSILVALLVVLYIFHEWKLKIDIKRSKFVERNSLENIVNREFDIVNQEFEKLKNTVVDKAKETIMSSAIHINSITQTPEERKETNKILETINYLPNGNGVEIMDTTKARQLIDELNKEIDKQEEENMIKEDELQKEIATLTAPEPKIPVHLEDLETSKELEKAFPLPKLPIDKTDNADREKTKPIIFTDENGNRYTLDSNGERAYI